IHRLADSGRVPAAEVECEAGAIVILVDRSAGFGGGGLDRGDDATGLRRRVAACLPAGADARRAADRGVARAADPHRQIRLHGLGRNGDALQLVEGAAEVDLVLPPQAADDLEALVGLPTACRWWRTAWPAARGRGTPRIRRSCRTACAACAPPGPPSSSSIQGTADGRRAGRFARSNPRRRPRTCRSSASR